MVDFSSPSAALHRAGRGDAVRLARSAHECPQVRAAAARLASMAHGLAPGVDEPPLHSAVRVLYLATGIDDRAAERGGARRSTGVGFAD